MTATRRRLALVLVALLVVVAGCFGVGGTPTPEPTETPTVTEASPTPTDTPTATRTPSQTPTATPDRGGEAAEALARHRDRVTEQPGVVATVRRVQRSGSGGETTMNGTIAYDPASTERFGTFDLEGGDRTTHVEQYSPPDASLMQTCIFESGACFSRVNDTVDPGTPFTHPVTEPAVLTDRPTFEDRGTVETDAGERRKFVAEGPAAVDEDDATVSFESVRLVLFVDPDTGLVTRYVYEGTYGDDGGTVEERVVVTYDYEAVDIERPGWFSEPAA